MKKILLVIVLLISTAYVINGEEEIDNDVNPAQIICDSNIWDLNYLNIYVDDSFTNIATVKHKGDNKYAFCIEPDILMKPCNNYTSSSYKNDKLDELAKIYKAYEYLGCPERLYVGTQMLIWETLGYYKTIDGKGSDAYGAQEIKSAINKIYKKYKPKIIVDYSYPLNEDVYLIDENNLLDKYEIKKYSDGLTNVGLVDNKLRFQIDDIYPIEKSITLKPKDHINKRINSGGKIYLATGSQSLFSYEGDIPDKYEEITITFKHHSGDLLINKTDEWSTNINEKIGFEIYKIEDNEKKIIAKQDKSTTWYTDDKGQLLIKDILYPGVYKIVEIDNNYKYLNNDKDYEFDIQINTLNQYDFLNINRDIDLNIIKNDKAERLITNTKFKLYDISNILTSVNGNLKRGLLMNDNEENSLLESSKIYSIEKGVMFNFNEVVDKDNELYLFINNASKAIKISDNILFNKYTFGDLYSMKFNSSISIQGLKQEYQQYESLDLNEIVYTLERNGITNSLLINRIEQEKGLHHLYFISELNNNSYIIEIPIGINIDIENKDINIYEYELLGNLLIGDKNEEINAYFISEFITDQGVTYINNPLNHNYPLVNEKIDLYNSNDEKVGTYTTDSNGLINLKGLENGTYYFNLLDERVYIDYQNNLFVNNLKLKQDRDYLLCESSPSAGYTYINNPCVYINTHNKANETNEELLITNSLTKYKFELFKVNGNYEINLDGAVFDIYLEEYNLNNQIELNNEIDIKNKNYLGKYISGYLNLNSNDFINVYDNNYEIHVFNNDQLICKVNYEECINLEVDEGIYKIKIFDVINGRYVEDIIKEVKKGAIEIDNIPYNQKLVLKEIKAPKSYYSDRKEIEILPNQTITTSYLPYYRINQLVIIPTNSI